MGFVSPISFPFFWIFIMRWKKKIYRECVCHCCGTTMGHVACYDVSPEIGLNERSPNGNLPNYLLQDKQVNLYWRTRAKLFVDCMGKTDGDHVRDNGNCQGLVDCNQQLLYNVNSDRIWHQLWKFTTILYNQITDSSTRWNLKLWLNSIKYSETVL